MTMPCERVTALMAVHNGLSYVNQAVQSVLNQRMTDFRFFIVDDGSVDGTAEYLDALTDPRVKVWHRSNHGLADSLNFALAYVNSPYVMRVDADDVCSPDKMEVQLEFLEKNPDVVACSCDIEFTLDGNSSGIYSHLPHRYGEICRALRRGGHALCHPALMMRSHVLKALGGYKVLNAGEDWALFVGLVNAGRVENVPAVLYRYRLHENSLSVRRALQIQKEKKKALHELSESLFACAPVISSAADLLYRRSIILMIKRKVWRGVMLLALVGILAPVRAGQKVCREFIGMFRRSRDF